MPSKSKNKKMVCEIPTEVSSPETSREIKQGLSFANLRLTDRKWHPQNVTPSRDRPNKINIQITNQKSNKQNGLRFNSPKSGSMKESKRILQENDQLRNRIRILSDQRDVLQQNYFLMKEQNQMIKQQYSKKEEQLKKKKDKYREYKRKSHQYDQIIPKLDELQTLQETVIQDNLILQEKQRKLREALEKIMTLTEDQEEDSFVFSQYINGQTGVNKSIREIAQQALQN